MGSHTIKSALLLLALWGATDAWASGPGGGKLYRYTREDGSTVLDFSVPPQYVSRGYTVLTTTGSVVEVVPPAMSVQERETMKAREPERAKAIELEAQQVEEDRRLLALYSVVEDAIRARDRKIDALQMQMSVDRGNAARLQAELSNTMELAANRERAGQSVPKDMNAKIDSLMRQVAALKDAVSKRQKDADDIAATYERDIARMRFLQDNPSLVLQLKAGDIRR